MILLRVFLLTSGSFAISCCILIICVSWCDSTKRGWSGVDKGKKCYTSVVQWQATSNVHKVHRSVWTLTPIVQSSYSDRAPKHETPQDVIHYKTSAYCMHLCIKTHCRWRWIHYRGHEWGEGLAGCGRIALVRLLHHGLCRCRCQLQHHGHLQETRQ